MFALVARGGHLASYQASLESAGWHSQPTYVMLQKFPTSRESGNVWFSREVLWETMRRVDVFIQCSGVSTQADWLTLNPQSALLKF